ncbi:MAG: hypothetical protein FJX84_05330 [Bacteroidetes bacterium]|nr:hypothetical protein [Bacteroidota bacterium]
MKNLNSLIGALAVASCFVIGSGMPGSVIILAIGLGLLLPLFLFIQFIIDLKEKNGFWLLNLLTSLGLWIFGNGALFKIMHWPGSGFLLSLALFIFFPCAILVAVFKGFVSSKNKSARIFAGLGGYLLSMSVLFKIMHWPGYKAIMTISIPAMALGIISLAILWKNSDKSNPILNAGFLLKSIFVPVLLMTLFLGLRVSKSILDSFVALEENTQRSAIVQLDRGNAYVNDLVQGIEQNKKEAPLKAAKCIYYLDIIKKIDKKTGDLIAFIDKIKFKILSESGEAVNSEKNFDKETIIWKKYNKTDPLRPSRMNLMAIMAKDQYDVPMHEIIGSELYNPDPSKSGMKLWKMLNDYRSFVVEEVGTFHTSIDSTTEKGVGEPNFTVKTKHINMFVDNMDLDKQVEAMLKASNVSPDDLGILKQIYMELTKQERFEEVNDVKNVHWIGKTFDHSPLVGALASLTTLQSEILSVRATTAGFLASKIQGGSSLTFNKLIALASASRSVVNPGDPIEISVVMGAYDSDNQPMVTGGNFTVSNGMGIMKTTAGTSDMKYSGTIAIKSRTGAIKELPWETNIIVLTSEKEASIETPEMQVFYEGIPIELKASATGMYKNVRMSVPSPYTAPQGSAGSVITVSLTGTDSDGNSVSLGSKKFIVKKAPKPELFWNGIEAGGQANASAGNLECRFGNNVPFHPNKGYFSITNYTITSEGSDLILKGSGNSISAAHLNALKNTQSKKITITVDYTGSGEGTVSSVFKN